ncbi:MAG: right-handed parallel beta-helix repeat-containing protein [Sedimentisphaerales bacterium]|nr:right-handed parallel beta-helix repeat-containing protein [Sedimentisphaerales bacterium]
MSAKTLLLVCILLAVLCTQVQAKIIYVDDDAAGTNDGSSWQNAFIYLQDALAIADISEKPVEIRVAQGIYKPDQGLIIDLPYWANFSLINNVTIKGGYAGANESDSNERNIELYESILSGDLNGDDIEVDDPCDLLNDQSILDNSINVLYSYENDANAVLDGFTIRDGKYNGSIISSGPWGGAGMFIIQGSPTIMNCTFTNNAFNGFGNGFGGAMLIRDFGSPTLINCKFIKNYAFRGGGVSVYYSRPGSRQANVTLENCVFSNNYSISDGAGMHIMSKKNIVMSNCTFTGNYSESSGGGVFTYGNIELENCTFNGNWAGQNSAIATSNSSIVNISNSIIWDGQNAISDSNLSTLTVSYSDIQGGLEGIGNINIDPLFTNPGYWANASDPNIIAEPDEPNAIWVEGNYHLKSQAGRWEPNLQTWVQKDVTSPCIDTGDPNSPIGFEPFPNGGYVNMGAYGGTSEASKSYFGEPLCETIVAGDINGDCRVDILDLEIMLIHWLESY